MAKSVAERIDDSLDGKDREDVLKFMEWLRSGMQDLTQSLRRTMALALLLMAAFELVSESKTTITIGSFQISNGSIVIVFIPALVAYLYLQTISDTVRLDTLQFAFTAALRQWSADAERNDLDLLIAPSQALYWNAVSTPGYPDNRSWLENLRLWTFRTVLLVVMAGVFAFESWSYYKLYRSPTIIWTISVCIAAFCLIAGLIQFLGDELYLS